MFQREVYSLVNNYKKIQLLYEDLNNTNLTYNEPYILTVERDGVLFDFLIRINENSNKAVVFGSGAYDSNKFNPPVFQRHSWIDRMSESVIYFNDPTLYLGKINLGWGFGTTKRHYLEEIAKILKLIFKKIMINYEDILFYGSSAGGFMSMVLAGYFEKAKVFVNNPQTIVNNYFVRHVNNLFTAVAPEYSRDEIERLFSDRLNVTQFFKKIKYVPEIYYLQNLACEHDIKKHLTPFILNLQEIDESLHFNKIHFDLYYDKEKDHNPIEMDETLYYINKLLNTENL